MTILLTHLVWPPLLLHESHLVQTPPGDSASWPMPHCPIPINGHMARKLQTAPRHPKTGRNWVSSPFVWAISQGPMVGFLPNSSSRQARVWHTGEALTDPETAKKHYRLRRRGAAPFETPHRGGAAPPCGPPAQHIFSGGRARKKGHFLRPGFKCLYMEKNRMDQSFFDTGRSINTVGPVLWSPNGTSSGEGVKLTLVCRHLCCFQD